VRGVSHSLVCGFRPRNSHCSSVRGASDESCAGLVFASCSHWYYYSSECAPELHAPTRFIVLHFVSHSFFSLAPVLS